jgi:ABC-2 type transport system ATP-binding protein
VGVRHRRRWLFRDLEVAVEPGEIVAVAGPPGSGRTTLLLALAGRFRLTAGTVTATGLVALGHVPDVMTPEPAFTVEEHVRERLALLGGPGPFRLRRRGDGDPSGSTAGLPPSSANSRGRFTLHRSQPEVGAVDLRGLDPRALGRDLSPYQRQVLGLVLAGLGKPAVIGLDGFDDGLDAGERAALQQILAEIAAEGTAVLFTAREVDPADVDSVISLGATAHGDEKPDLSIKTEISPATEVAERSPRGEEAQPDLAQTDIPEISVPGVGEAAPEAGDDGAVGDGDGLESDGGKAGLR